MVIMISSNDILIDVKNLYSVYETNDSCPLFILNDVNMQIQKGKTIGIIGESGSGKTQLVSSMLGIQSLKPGVIYGDIQFNLGDRIIPVYEMGEKSDNALINPLKVNKKVSPYMKKIKRELVGFIPQDPKTYLNPFWTIEKLFYQSYKLNDNNKLSFEDFINKHLVSAGIKEEKVGDIKYKRPSELSGGEAQRVMIGFVLSKSPTIIIADELTTGVDVTTQTRIIETIKMLNTDERTIIIISHDLGLLDHLVDEYFVVYAGFVIEHIKNKKYIYNSDALHPYTKKLVNSLNRNKLSNNTGLDAMKNNSERLRKCPLSYPGLCDVLEKNRDNPKADFTNRCSLELPEQVNNYNGENSGWIRCWYHKQ